MRHAGWVVGFHGCREGIAQKLLAGEEHFRVSRNEWDWLGDGVYFWEGDARRALQFVQEYQKHQSHAVVGAYLELGHCLDLTTQDGLELVREAHGVLERIIRARGEILPDNIGKRRYLDRMVINLARELAEAKGAPRIDSVRGAFPEAQEAYPGAGFTALNHIQITILDPKRIRGLFRPETGGWLAD